MDIEYELEHITGTAISKDYTFERFVRESHAAWERVLEQRLNWHRKLKITVE